MTRAARLFWQAIGFLAAVIVGYGCVYGLVIGIGEPFRAGLERGR